MGASTLVRWLGTAMLSLVVAAAAGCTTGAGPNVAPTAPATRLLLDPALLCKAQTKGGTAVHFGRDSYLGGIVLGSGATGIVLGHRNDANLCEWMPYAHVLADRGYHVLAFDFAEFGSSNPRPDGGTIADDMAVAAAFLRTRGVGTLVLIGASMGGTASVAAATMLTPPPAGVITLSAPGGFAGANANTAALTVPALYLAGSGDGGYAAIARSLAEQTPTGLGATLIVDSPNHGTGLLVDPKVVGAIEAFLAAHAPAAG